MTVSDDILANIDEIIDLTDGLAIAYGEGETVRVSVSENLARTGKLSDEASRLILSLVDLPCLPPTPSYSLDVAPPTTYVGICKSLESNSLTLVWHIGPCLPTLRLKCFELWTCLEPSRKWTKVGNVNALVPPMSCTISKVPYGICHFTVRAVDFEGRPGPFAVPASCIRVKK